MDDPDILKGLVDSYFRRLDLVKRVLGADADIKRYEDNILGSWVIMGACREDSLDRKPLGLFEGSFIDAVRRGVMMPEFYTENGRRDPSGPYQGYVSKLEVMS